ncbi:MAG: Holliday junction branch migration protein RuvA, partial [Deltaproteobacteria bacterium]
GGAPVIVHLRGTLLDKDLAGAVVDCQGVGYGLSMSLSGLAKLPKVGETVAVWVHTHASADALRLFGFVEPSERDSFLVLLATNGVGPRLALAILSALSPAELSLAVSCGDKAALCVVPGVGKKKAERLLVELRDRLPRSPSGGLAHKPVSVKQDLLSALQNLGFTQQVAERAAQRALDHSPNQDDLTLLLRTALRTTTAPQRA